MLLEEVDHRTMMCQVGEGKGLVQRCHMKVINPLAPQEAPQVTLLSGGESFCLTYLGYVKNVVFFTVCTDP